MEEGLQHLGREALAPDFDGDDEEEQEFDVAKVDVVEEGLPSLPVDGERPSVPVISDVPPLAPHEALSSGAALCKADGMDVDAPPPAPIPAQAVAAPVAQVVDAPPFHVELSHADDMAAPDLAPEGSSARAPTASTNPAPLAARIGGDASSSASVPPEGSVRQLGAPACIDLPAQTPSVRPSRAASPPPKGRRLPAVHPTAPASRASRLSTRPTTPPPAPPHSTIPASGASLAERLSPRASRGVALLAPARPAVGLAALPRKPAFQVTHPRQ